MHIKIEILCLFCWMISGNMRTKGEKLSMRNLRRVIWGMNAWFMQRCHYIIIVMRSGIGLNRIRIMGLEFFAFHSSANTTKATRKPITSETDFGLGLLAGFGAVGWCDLSVMI